MASAGIPYFPLNVSLDEKWELIEAEFGLTGFSVVVKLLQRIYGQHGYYCEWTNEVALLFGRQCGLNRPEKPGGNVVSEIVNASIKRGIFNRDLYDKYSILTSKGIQERYFGAVSRRKQIEIDKRYLLVNVAHFLKDDSIKWKNVNISLKNDDILEQRKVKERRVKESKGDIGDSDKPNPTPPPNMDYQSIAKLFNSICVSLPKVQKLNDTRRKAIKSAHTSVGGIVGLETLFKKVESSDFLTGRNGKFTGCGFDWILKPANLTKIAEGNYDNRNANHSKPKKDTSFDLDEYEEMVDGFTPVYRK